MANKPPKDDPASLLLDYQTDWVNDEARFKFGLMARQVGKDFSSGFEGVRDCFRAEQKKKKTDWLIAAPSERQSLESLQKWKEWAEVFNLAIADYQEERDGGKEALLKTATITFPRGSRVIAVPGKPETVRGYSANVLMTEFAFFENPDATWRAMYPSITNPMRGLKKVRLITTPNGIGNKAHSIWMKNFQGADAAAAALIAEDKKELKIKWSCHFVDIHTAIKRGLPLDVEELKEGMDDPEGWAQEYECQFLDVQSVLLTYELIASCESAEAREVCPPEFWLTNTTGAPLFMGIDFGRKRDLTCAWTDAIIGDVAQAQEVLTLENTPTDKQVEILAPRIRRVQRVCLDYTGPGVGMGDYLVKEFGEWNPEKHLYGKIELCNFSNTLKVEIFSKLRMAFEKKLVRVPISRVIREDLHSINRVSTAGGSVTYKAPHTADGHADRCTAKALAERARGFSGGSFGYSSLRQSRRQGLRVKGALA